MVTTRYSDQQGSKSRQKAMRLYKQWHRPISKRFIKPPYSISRATSIDPECCRLPTTSVLGKKLLFFKSRTILQSSDGIFQSKCFSRSTENDPFVQSIAHDVVLANNIRHPLGAYVTPSTHLVQEEKILSGSRLEATYDYLLVQAI